MYRIRAGSRQAASDFLSQASHLATCDPEREKPLITPGLYTLTRCVSRYGCLGAEIRLGWGRQNEHDRVMVNEESSY